MDDAMVYDLSNQQFLSALKELAHTQQSDDQAMAAAVLHLITHKPEAIHVIDQDYKEATIMEHWSQFLVHNERARI